MSTQNSPEEEEHKTALKVLELLNIIKNNHNPNYLTNIGIVNKDDQLPKVRIAISDAIQELSNTLEHIRTKMWENSPIDLKQYDSLVEDLRNQIKSLNFLAGL